MSKKRFERWNDHSCKVKDNQEEKLLNWEDVVQKLNKLYEENKQLKKSEKINMEYAEQIVEENQKLRISKNDLRIENERLKSRNNYNLEDCLLEIVELKEEKEQLKKKLESLQKVLHLVECVSDE